jgi:DNA-binding transcriptional regulator LsrR (DeoR family)
MHYSDNLDQSEIGKRLGLSRHVVRRLLYEAKSEGIFRVVYDSPDEQGDLEQQVVRRFGLKRVIIVSGNPATEEGYLELLKKWGKTAGRYFDEVVDGHHNQNLRVGISGGETLTHFANSVEDRMRRSVHVSVTSLVARGPILGSHVEPMINASMLWFRSGRQPGRCQYVTISPYDIESLDKQNARLVLDKVRAEMERLSRMEVVEDHIRELDNIDIAFASLATAEATDDPQLDRLSTRLRGLVISSLYAPTRLLRIPSKSDAVPKGGQKSTDIKPPVGDFCYCLIDEDGNTHDEWSFFLSAGYYSERTRGLRFFSEMVKAGKIVVIIGGAYKERVILAALKKRLFNVWITDEGTAKYALLHSKNPDSAPPHNVSIS